MRRGLLALVLVLVATAAAHAAVGDTVIFKDTDFDTSDTLDLAASAGTENICQTVDHSDTIKLCTYDGTNETCGETLTDPQVGRPVFLRNTETERYRIKPGTGAANNALIWVRCVRVK